MFIDDFVSGISPSSRLNTVIYEARTYNKAVGNTELGSKTDLKRGWVVSHDCVSGCGASKTN